MLAIKRLDLGGSSVSSAHVAVSNTKTTQQLEFVYGNLPEANKVDSGKLNGQTASELNSLTRRGH